ncbi:MAG: cell division protein FtsW [Gammaproteobacteria bacterium]|jgi:cell division protein FtsW
MSAVASEIDRQAMPSTILSRREALPIDLLLVSAVAAVMLLGLVMVASSSITIAAEQGHPLKLFWRQFAYAACATAMILLISRTPIALWRVLGPWLLLLGAGLLALVIIPGVGREVNGSMRWLALGPVNIQPSEFVKIFVVLYLAGYLVRRNDHVRTRSSGFFKPIALMSLIALLLLAEPDYGAAVVMFATTLTMLFLGGVPFISFSIWVLAIVSVFVVMMVAAPYRVERLLAFVNPWADPFGSGFQLTQALIAIGRGEWLGVGLGQSVQKLHYLPEAHTDFLFAVLSEELGLLGAGATIALFAFISWRAFQIGRRALSAGQPYAGYLAYGVGLLVGMQAYVNIGVNLGLLPTKGLTLPLMSYGGSSLVANAIGIGLLLRVGAEIPVAMRGAS